MKKITFPKNTYRIINDDYSGFEAQIKFWWFPFFWFEMDGDNGYPINTHMSLELAHIFINRKKNKKSIKRKIYWIGK